MLYLILFTYRAPLDVLDRVLPRIGRTCRRTTRAGIS